MHIELILKDHKICLSDLIYEGGFSTYIEKEVDSVVKFLGFQVQTLRNFTLEDLFVYIEKEKDELEKIFYSELGGFKLQPFLDEIKNEPKSEDIFNKIIFQRIFEKHELSGKIDLHSTIYTNLHLSKNNDELSYSCSFKKLSDIKNTLIKIDNKSELSITKLNKNNTYDYKKVNLGFVPFTLYDLLQGLMHEITFFGYPDDRDESWNNISKDMEEVQNDMEEEELLGLKNDEKYKDWDSFKDELDELRNNKYEEDKKSFPELKDQYIKLVRNYKDLENVNVKRFFMENKQNMVFQEVFDGIYKKFNIYNPLDVDAFEKEVNRKTK